jgi:hypothetical protein
LTAAIDEHTKKVNVAPVHRRVVLQVHDNQLHDLIRIIASHSHGNAAAHNGML